MGYSILLNELRPLELEKTARILAKAQNMVYADATRNVRYCCGILAENLTFDEAKSISAELNGEGVGVFYIEEGEMYRPEPAVQTSNADCLEECFNVEDPYGRVDRISWGNMILLSLGRIVERKERPAAGGVPPGEGVARAAGAIAGFLLPIPVRPRTVLSEPPSGRRVTEEEHLIIDIFSGEPQKRHFRIRKRGFNYDYLGERLRPNSAENFRLFVEDTVRFATRAYGNRGINAYLSGDEPKKMDYGSLDLFDRENLWLLQLITLSAPDSTDAGTGR